MEFKQAADGQCQIETMIHYTRPKDGKHNYEIDFLLSRGAKT